MFGFKQNLKVKYEQYLIDKHKFSVDNAFELLKKHKVSP